MIVLRCFRASSLAALAVLAALSGCTAEDDEPGFSPRADGGLDASGRDGSSSTGDSGRDGSSNAGDSSSGSDASAGRAPTKEEAFADLDGTYSVRAATITGDNSFGYYTEGSDYDLFVFGADSRFTFRTDAEAEACTWDGSDDTIAIDGAGIVTVTIVDGDNACTVSYRPGAGTITGASIAIGGGPSVTFTAS